MPNENLESTAVLERPTQPEVVEFSGKHLEAAFTFRANYHKQRVLEKFGGGSELPPLPKAGLDVRLPESEKRFQKAYDLLQREQPAAIPVLEDGLSRDYVIALADNLAWKGIENSITTSHMDEIGKALIRMAADGKADNNSAAELKAREKGLKPIALDDNHFYRDFFDSEAAKTLGVDSPLVMKKLLKRASLTGNGEDSIATLARGISLEIAALRYITRLLDGDENETIVGFGTSEEDREGGDIVVLRGEKILYIDLKNMRPGPGKGFAADEIERGYRLYADTQKHIYKAVVWPESEDAVADDSFRLTDPSLKNALQKVLSETS
jgi:hypothetical protein